MITSAELAAPIDFYLPPDQAALLKGMTLGIDIDRESQLYSEMQAAGLLHIVVLSGSNISLLTTLIIDLLTPLLGRKFGCISALVGIGVFVLFVGIEPPVARAAVMGSFRIFGSLIGQKTNELYTLFLSALILIAVFPDWISSLSFQLSCAATAGIALFSYPKQLQSLRPSSKSFLSTTCGYFKEELWIAVVAYFATLPLLFSIFRTVTLFSPITNVLIAWTLPPICVFGLLLVITAWIFPPAAEIIALFLYPLLSFVIYVAEVTYSLPLYEIQL
jgi:competence protein ComEC